MARPEEIEEEAVKRVCTLARHSNVPIIIDQPTGQSAVIKKKRVKLWLDKPQPCPWLKMEPSIITKFGLTQLLL